MSDHLIAKVYEAHSADSVNRCVCCGAFFPCDAHRLADALERTIAERDEAQAHARDHHLEACMTCAVMESERDEARAHRKRLSEILRVVEGESRLGSCDWGFCNREAMGLREDTTGQYKDDDGLPTLLPVCDWHTESYEKARADNAALLDVLRGRIHDSWSRHNRNECTLCAVLEDDHPGATLLADMQAKVARIAALERALEIAKATVRDAYRDLSMAYDFLTKPENYGTDPCAWLDDGMQSLLRSLRELGDDTFERAALDAARREEME